MHIRKASVDDLEAIIAINAFVQQQHADQLPDLFKSPAESQETRDAFRKYLSDSTSLMLFAEEAQPAGYLWAQFQNRPESWIQFSHRRLYIQHLAVAPTVQAARDWQFAAEESN